MTQILSIETRTLHAELMERLGVREAHRSIGDLEGSFTTKYIGGVEYLYFLHYEPGGARRNISLGRKSPLLDELMTRHREGREEDARDLIGIRELCLQIKAGRAVAADIATARVIRELAEGGLFRVGGVLVGTHAFACIGNLLGVIWDSTTLGTRDLDIAVERNVSVAVPGLTADIPKSLESLSMGFLPIPRLNRKHHSTSYSIRKSPLRVDLLTTMKRGSEDPVFIKRLNAAAQPLKYLDYLIHEPIQGAMLNGGATLVSIPQPIRYALHKLIVSQERDIISGAKKHKDLWQAYQLLSWFVHERPSDLEPAWNAFVGNGKSWKSKAEAGFTEMKRLFGPIGFEPAG